MKDKNAYCKYKLVQLGMFRNAPVFRGVSSKCPEIHPSNKTNLLGRCFPVLGHNDQIASIPMDNQLLTLKGKARPTLIWLVQIYAFISCHYKLEVLGGIAESGAAQSTATHVQFQQWTVLHWECITLQSQRKGKGQQWGQKSNQAKNGSHLSSATSSLPSRLAAYLNFLSGSYKQMSCFAWLAKHKPSNWMATFL